ncbi:GLPGLI family protein [Arachidicoccus sp.]|uniref:GLPGLI family protein n=1 Tax=Arachidicoccus sp. TaxID=1872624 RepID=UPI003D1A454C
MKNLLKTFLFLFIAVISSQAFSQHAIFLSHGKIQFEKKVNMYALIQEEMKLYPDDPWMSQYFDAYKKTNPQFATTDFSLTFDGQKTLYQPVDQSDNNRSFYSYSPKNTIYSDLENQQAVSRKKVFEDVFLVKDSTRKIQWKITDETREIAGFHCRRANALIMDSIYVVAFYTDQITISGGPESFNGLPGMILGVALPYDHITWFATKIAVGTAASDEEIVPPVKGKVVSNKELYLKIKDAMKDWGGGGASILKNVML